MARLFNIFLWILITSNCYSQEQSNKMVMKQDTVFGKVVKMQTYEFKSDSLFIKKEELNINQF
jgi:hypothetical protein